VQSRQSAKHTRSGLALPLPSTASSSFSSLSLFPFVVLAKPSSHQTTPTPD
jgi:hypothetical protein